MRTLKKEKGRQKNLGVREQKIMTLDISRKYTGWNRSFFRSKNTKK